MEHGFWPCLAMPVNPGIRYKSELLTRVQKDLRSLPPCPWPCPLTLCSFYSAPCVCSSPPFDPDLPQNPPPPASAHFLVSLSRPLPLGGATGVWLPFYQCLHFTPPPSSQSPAPLPPAPSPVCRWVVPLVWLPFFSACMAYAHTVYGAPPAALPIYLAVGVVLWQLLEYMIHRHLFHARPTNYWCALADSILMDRAKGPPATAASYCMDFHTHQISPCCLCL